MIDSLDFGALFRELETLHSAVETLSERYSELMNEKTDLEKLVNELRGENDGLKQYALNLQKELEQQQVLPSRNIGEAVFSTEEREGVKEKINELIDRIDYHLKNS